MNEISRKIASLPLDKLTSLAHGLQERKSEGEQKIGRRTSDEPMLSFAQERLWFLSQMAPDVASYNVLTVLRLLGPLNLDALQRSVDDVFNHHEVLRTVFEAENGLPRPIIRNPEPLHIAMTSLEGLPVDMREPELRRLITAEESRPLNVAGERLVRLALIVLSPTEHVLFFTFHHIVCDEESTTILAGEFLAAYAAYVRGRLPQWIARPIDYFDFAAWQRRRLRDAGLQQQMDYWKSRLAGAPALEMPTDRPRPSIISFRGARVSRQLPLTLVPALRKMCREESVTLFMALLAAFQLLLSRYTGQTDVLTGTPSSSRNRRELEEVVGFLGNTLVLRGDLSGNPTWRMLLQRTRRIALEAYDHQDVPFEKLVETLQPDRNTNRNPLFQVLLTLDQEDQVLETTASVPELTIRSEEFEVTTTKFDIDLHARMDGDRLELTASYSTDLFDRDRIERMLGHLEMVLQKVIVDPDRPVSNISLLTGEECRQLIAWNETAVAQRERPLHEIFWEQSALTPEATAVVWDGGCVSYAQLRMRAEEIASALRRLGVVLESKVGIFLNRSPDQIAAVLGILAAGGACVPMDLEYPPERLGFMLQDAGVSVLLTEESLRGVLPPTTAPIVNVKSIGPKPPAEAGIPITGVAPENAFYIIYTSGSTGRPKGIVLGHGALTNLVQWHLSTLIHSARTLQFAPLSFDASFHEIFTALCSGGSLHLIEEKMRRDPPALFRLLRNQRIAKAIFPVVTLQALAQTCSEAHDWLPQLQEITTTGEQMHISPPVRQLFRQKTGYMLHNHYGPSETHVVTSLTLSGQPENWSDYPSIGRPISNTQLFVLDPDLHSVPIGVLGELYIGGASLARGYLNRPEVTAENFIPDNLSGAPGARLYKTGDMVRYGSDGNLIFAGRRDRQVKLRGFRIELKEIESALSRHAAVREVAVLIDDDSSTGKQILAFIVPVNPAAPPSSSEIRAFLGRSLPSYMVPSRFMVLDSLLSNSNGKLDQPGLLALAHAVTPIAAENLPVAPEQERMLQLWREVLSRDQLGVRDSFFEMGGHSLLATQLIARSSKAFQVEIPLRVIFDKPNVAEFTEEVMSLAGAVGTREFQEIKAERLPEVMDIVSDISQVSDEEVERQIEQLLKQEKLS